jgi:hypothetical protein
MAAEEIFDAIPEQQFITNYLLLAIQDGLARDEGKPSGAPARSACCADEADTLSGSAECAVSLISGLLSCVRRALQSQFVPMARWDVTTSSSILAR